MLRQLSYAIKIGGFHAGRIYYREQSQEISREDTGPPLTSPLLQEVTIEEIQPTKTISPAGRSVVTAYNVVTHTSTITDHQAAAQQNNNRNLLQGLFQGLLPSNRWVGNFLLLI